MHLVGASRDVRGESAASSSHCESTTLLVSGDALRPRHSSQRRHTIDLIATEVTAKDMPPTTPDSAPPSFARIIANGCNWMPRRMRRAQWSERDRDCRRGGSIGVTDVPSRAPSTVSVRQM
jgi:hypothetical protein